MSRGNKRRTISQRISHISGRKTTKMLNSKTKLVTRVMSLKLMLTRVKRYQSSRVAVC